MLTAPYDIFESLCEKVDKRVWTEALMTVPQPVAYRLIEQLSPQEDNAENEIRRKQIFYKMFSAVTGGEAAQCEALRSCYRARDEFVSAALADELRDLFLKNIQ